MWERRQPLKCRSVYFEVQEAVLTWTGALWVGEIAGSSRRVKKKTWSDRCLNGSWRNKSWGKFSRELRARRGEEKERLLVSDEWVWWERRGEEAEEAEVGVDKREDRVLLREKTWRTEREWMVRAKLEGVEGEMRGKGNKEPLSALVSSC